MISPDENSPAARLRQARKDAGFHSAAAAAEALGVKYPTYASHENGSRGIESEALQHYARRFGVSVDWLLTGIGDSQRQPDTVPIRGKAGAGPDGTVMFATGDDHLGEAEAPINATADTSGLEVEGQSMRGVAEDGSLIFYDGREPPNEGHIGELCVCWLQDERVMVKYPYPGSQAGLWNLESTSAQTLRDVPIRWFSHVITIVPRRAARALIRKRVDVRPADVRLSR